MAKTVIDDFVRENRNFEFKSVQGRATIRNWRICGVNAIGWKWVTQSHSYRLTKVLASGKRMDWQDAVARKKLQHNEHEHCRLSALWSLFTIRKHQQRTTKDDNWLTVWSRIDKQRVRVAESNEVADAAEAHYEQTNFVCRRWRRQWLTTNCTSTVHMTAISRLYSIT